MCGVACLYILYDGIWDAGTERDICWFAGLGLLSFGLPRLPSCGERVRKAYIKASLQMVWCMGLYRSYFLFLFLFAVVMGVKFRNDLGCSPEGARCLAT